MHPLCVKLCLPVGLSAVVLLAGCATPNASSVAASNRQIAGVLPVQRHFERKSDRWYDIRQNESVSFGAWRTGTIDRNHLKGKGTHVQVGKFDWVNQKTGTALQFDLHTPHGDVCNVSINSARHDKDFGVGPVVIGGDGVDRISGTIALTNGETWPFQIDGFHTENLIGDDMSGKIQVGSETIMIREDNSENRVVGMLSGFSGAAFSWNGHPTGRVLHHGAGLKIDQRTVELESNIPAHIQTATAAIAATLLVVNRIEGPSEQSPGARRVELFTN